MQQHILDKQQMEGPQGDHLLIWQAKSGGTIMGKKKKKRKEEKSNQKNLKRVREMGDLQPLKSWKKSHCCVLGFHHVIIIIIILLC